jgi:hypothetical protein
MQKFFFAVPFALALILASGVRADDKAGEWTVSLGCAHCSFEKDTGATSCGAAGKTADGKVVVLKGDAVKGVNFKKGGDYVVKGKISADGKSIEVSEIKPKA